MNQNRNNNTGDNDSGLLSALIIDDDDWITRLFTSKTEQMGMKTLSANDPIDGIAIAVKHRPKIIFLDIYMPEVSGYTLLKILKKIEDTADIPVIVISGNMSRESLRSSLNFGAAGFISKPISQKVIFDKLNEVLDSDLLRNLQIPEEDFDNGFNENIN